MAEAGAIDWMDPSSVDFAITRRDIAVCHPLYTNVKYADTSTCGGREHCSTAIDDSIPYLEKVSGEKCYIYEKLVWPLLAQKYKSKACKVQREEKSPRSNSPSPSL